MTGPSTTRPRTLWLLLAATALCYLIGYPVALVGHSAAGWVFVGLGGPLLMALGALTVRHLHRTGGLGVAAARQVPPGGGAAGLAGPPPGAADPAAPPD